MDSNNAASQDFSNLIHSLRSIDLTKYLKITDNPSIHGPFLSYQIILIFFIVFTIIHWSSFFIILKILQKFQNINSKNTYRLNNFILSSMHAVIAIFGWLHMTLISCKNPGKTFYTDKECLDFTSPGMELIITVHLSYFFNDIVL